MISKFTKTQLLGFPATAVVLLFPLFPLPRPASLSGHPWKVELLVFLAFAVIFMVMAFKRITPAIPADIRFVRIAIAIFMVWSAASLAWAGSTWSVLHHTAVWTAYLFVFLLSSHVLAAKGGLRFLQGLTVFIGCVIGILLILGYAQLILNPDYESEFRVTYSKYSEILVLVCPFFLVVGSSEKSRTSSIYAVAATVAFTAIVMSLSRASFVSVLSGIGVASVLLAIYSREKRTLLRAGVILVLFAAVFLSAQLFSTEKAENTLVGRFTSEKPYQTASNDIRRLLIGVSTEMIRGNPLLGVGADNFGLEINPYRRNFARRFPDDTSLSAGEEMMLERAHNEYLQIVSELGLIGGFIFAGILVASAMLFRKRVAYSENTAELSVRLGAAAGIIAFLVSSLFSSFSFRAVQNGILFFVMLALAVCPYKSTAIGPPKRDTYGTVVPQLFFSVFAAALFSLQALSMYFIVKAERSERLYDAAYAYSRAAIFDANSAAIDMALATRYFNEKDPVTAARYYSDAIEKGGGVIAAYHYLAMSRRMNGDISGAEKTMRECISIYPHSVYARVFLADILRSANKNPDAELQFAKASKIDKKAAETWREIFTNGALETAIAARKNDQLIKLSALDPKSVVEAVIATEKLYKSDNAALE